MGKLSTCLLALLGFVAVNAAAGPGPDDELITKLPGCDLRVQGYSGYLAASETKKLHYVYFSSRDKPATDPLVIWFNGGPGCSSLLGLFGEHGPCVIDEGKSAADIRMNPFSWNTRANMLYIESPAGVGFSIAGDEDDIIHTDRSQSEDANAALKDFYTKFPTLKTNDLFISGESYAGIYVPYLAY
jgi:carboxypeptidase C (cathepsin A)